MLLVQIVHRDEARALLRLAHQPEVGELGEQRARVADGVRRGQEGHHMGHDLRRGFSNGAD